jgi:hypothetical protein
VKQVPNFNSFGNLISAEEKDVDIKYLPGHSKK